MQCLGNQHKVIISVKITCRSFTDTNYYIFMTTEKSFRILDIKGSQNMNSAVTEFCRSVKLRGLCFILNLELFHFSIFFALVKNFRSALSLAFQNATSCHLNVKTDEMRAILRKTMSLSLCNTLIFF